MNDTKIVNTEELIKEININNVLTISNWLF